MKRNFVLVLCCVVLLFLVGCSSIPQLPGAASKSDGGKVDLEVLATREGRIIVAVKLATVSFLESYAHIYEAVGKKEEAEKLSAMAKELKASPNDKEKIKEGVGVVNNANKELKDIDLNKALNEELAKKYLGESILNLGAGIVLDGIAVPDAASLLKDAKDAMVKVKASPMTYGPGALAKLGDIVAIATFISSDVATQLDSVAGVSKKIYEYATLKGIPVPTQEEINKKAKALEKE